MAGANLAPLFTFPLANLRAIPLFPLGEFHNLAHYRNHTQENEVSNGDHYVYPAVGARLADGQAAKRPSHQASAQGQSHKGVDGSPPILHQVASRYAEDRVKYGKEQHKGSGRHPGKAVTDAYGIRRSYPRSQQIDYQNADQREARLVDGVKFSFKNRSIRHLPKTSFGPNSLPS